MKSILVSILLFSTPAFAKKVEVACMCSYQFDYLIQPSVAVFGTDTHVSDEDLKNCQIVDKNGRATAQGSWGKAVNVGACGLAVTRAEGHCMDVVQRKTGTDAMNRPQVTIEDNTCSAKISE